MSDMTAIRNPRVTLNLVQRDQTVSIEPHRVLLVGQKLSGTAVAGLNPDLPRTDAEINALFGARSHLAMIARAFRRVNPWTKVDTIALADAGAGTAGTAKIVIAGTATEAKTLIVGVVSSRFHGYEIDVEVGDGPDDVMGKLEALVAADTKAPCTAALSTTSTTDDTITFTASNKGTICNSWLLNVLDAYRRPGTVAGLTLTLTGWASGATDPTLTTALDEVANIRYQGVVWPAAYATTVPKAWINARFNLDNDIKDGVVFSWIQDTFSNAKTVGAAMNSPSWLFMSNESMDTSFWKGPHLPAAPDEVAAYIVAARALRFETGISISHLVVNNEGRDQFGGRHTASLPYFNTPLTYVDQPYLGSGYTYAEQLELEASGVSVIGANVRDNAVIASVMVTSYINDAAGNPDDTWKYLNWRDTHSTIREFFVNNIREDFAQHRLTTGSAVPNLAIADEPAIRAALLGYYDVLTDDALTVRGREDRQYFEDNTTVTLTPSQRLVEIFADVPMVSQFGEARGSIKFHFTA